MFSTAVRLRIILIILVVLSTVAILQLHNVLKTSTSVFIPGRETPLPISPDQPQVAKMQITEPLIGLESDNVTAQPLLSNERRCPSHPQQNVLHRIDVKEVPPPPRMVICMIAHGWKAQGYEDINSIKGSRRSMDLALRGILRRVSNKCKLHFYFITGEEDAKRIREESILGELLLHNEEGNSGIMAPTNITYTFMPLDEAQLSHWMRDIGHVPTHRTGAAGNVKFFYPQLLPHEEKVLMLDSDVLVDRDVCELWEHFEFFPRDQLFAFAPQKVPMQINKDNQFNAGVALLHLERMRQANWLALARNSIAAWDASPSQSPKCCAHGDQSVFHMVRWYRPLVFQYVLPRWWNLNKCHSYMKFEEHYRRFIDRTNKESHQRRKRCWLLNDLSGNSTSFAQVLDDTRHHTKATPSKKFSELVIQTEHSPQQLHGGSKRQQQEQRYVTDGTKPLLDEEDVFVGIVHLGCCKKCSRRHLKSSVRWQRLLADIEAFDAVAMRRKLSALSRV